MKTVKISQWNSGNQVLVGVATVADDYPVAATAAESCGLQSVVADSVEWTGDDDYEWTGDEVYEIVPTTYTLTLRDEQGSEWSDEIDQDYSRDDVRTHCEEWVRGGEWGSHGASVDVSWEIIEDTTGEVMEEGCCTVEIEPDHATLITQAVGRWNLDTICGSEPADHDWTSDGEGGCRENPGVWSTGGTSMSFAAHCRKCGLHRSEHSTGSQRNPGEHDTVEYRMLSDEEITQHIANGDMDEREPECDNEEV